MESASTEKGLKTTTVWLLIGTALFFDTLQIILDFLLMGWLVTIIGSMTFWLWFKILGYSFLKPKRVAGSAATLIIDAVPVLGWFAWTVAISTFVLKNKLVEKVPGDGATKLGVGEVGPDRVRGGKNLGLRSKPTNLSSKNNNDKKELLIPTRTVDSLTPQHSNLKVLGPGEEYDVESMTGHPMKVKVPNNGRYIKGNKNTGMSLEDYHGHFVIDGVHVDEPMRRSGLATKMYQEALELAEKEGKQGVVSLKMKRNEVSEKMWHKFREEGRVDQVTLNGDKFDRLKPGIIQSSSASIRPPIPSRQTSPPPLPPVPSRKVVTPELLAAQSKRNALYIVKEEEIKEILTSSFTPRYQEVVQDVRQSKIEWIQSEAFATRLKLMGATDEEIKSIISNLFTNALGGQAYIISPDKFTSLVNTLHEITGETNIKEAAAFYAHSDMGLPESISHSLFIQEKTRPPLPPLPGKPAATDSTTTSVDTTLLHHEYGHLTAGKIFEEPIFKKWNPRFKEGAKDPKYIGLIHETDTRIRSMFRDLEGYYNPYNEHFEIKHLLILKKLKNQGKLNNDTQDLLNHYEDDYLIELANTMPAI